MRLMLWERDQIWCLHERGEGKSTKCSYESRERWWWKWIIWRPFMCIFVNRMTKGIAKSKCQSNGRSSWISMSIHMILVSPQVKNQILTTNMYETHRLVVTFVGNIQREWMIDVVRIPVHTELWKLRRNKNMSWNISRERWRVPRWIQIPL